jgi:hypothetical protein
MNLRNRALLDLAHRVTTCMNCDRHTPGCEPAHENGIAAGKGQSIKGQDNRHAACCFACHKWYDSGGVGLDPSGLYTPKRDDKKAMWTRAHLRTFDYYWSQGWLKVAA